MIGKQQLHTAYKEETDCSLEVGETLSPKTFAGIRKTLLLQCCKWDPQIEDTSVLLPFPLLLRRCQWRLLAELAEALTAETLAAEEALLARPDLWSKLGVVSSLRHALRHEHRPETPATAQCRVMRFDFHPTDEGWRISEVNSDVPGGYAEASEFSQCMAEHFPAAAPCGLPGPVLAEVLVRTAREIDPANARIGLLCAPGFMEDLQVTSYLARQVNLRGVEAHVLHPLQLLTECDQLHLDNGYEKFPLSLLFRFFQAEWLSAKPNRAAAALILGKTHTPVINPSRAMFSESKRFPLVWRELGLTMETWRRYLPETRDPRAVPWRRDQTWLLKAAFCNNGDAVCSPLDTPAKHWRRAAAHASVFPNAWIAQRRFSCISVDTPAGPLYPCLGVYTVGGRASGVYGRLSRSPVVTFQAHDVAVLVKGPV